MAPSPTQLTYVSVEGHRVPWRPGESLFAALMGAGLPVSSACSGHGSCGLCVVQLFDAPLPDPSARELGHLAHGQLLVGARLACCLLQPRPYRVRLGGLAQPL